MNDTPETDARIIGDRDLVPAYFARDLERANAALTAENGRLREALAEAPCTTPSSKCAYNTNPIAATWRSWRCDVHAILPAIDAARAAVTAQKEGA